MDIRSFLTSHLVVLTGLMSLMKIVGMIPVHKIQGGRFHATLIVRDAQQSGAGFTKSLHRPVARNGISLGS